MVGRTVAQYQFIEKLGAGGMGEIYKAQDTRLHRFVAIKVLPASKSGDPERRRRFLQEAQAASSLNHPSIITIHDVLSEGDTEFMVMEYVQGKTLNDIIPKGGLRVPQALKYALQMADALSAAHAAGIVHRDLKPANVMVTDSGGFVKVLDFGLAKLTEQNPVTTIGEDTETVANAPPLTVEGSIMGTVSYMSPEQAQGKRVDPRSDIFSFGAVLYEMVTGRRAFEGDSSLSTLSSILRDEAKPMADVAPDVPVQLELVIQQCLRKVQDDRYQTMREVQAALSTLKRDSDSGSLYTSRSGISAPGSGLSSITPPPPSSMANAGASPSAINPPTSVLNIGGKRVPVTALAVLAGVFAAAGVGVYLWGQKQAKEKAAALASRNAAQQAADTASQALAQAQLAQLQAQQAAAKVADETLDNDGVMLLMKEKVPVSLILDQIRNVKITKFDLSTTALVALNKAGVPQVVIDQMRNPKRPVPQSAPVASNAKQTPAPPPVPVPSAAPAPVPVPIATAPSPSPVLTATPAPAPAVPQSASVTVPDSTPFRITLASDIPSDADTGRPLRFVAADDLRVQGALVIPKGAAVYGAISESGKKKKLFGFGGSGKLSFTLSKADGAGGHSIPVRALAAKRSDGPTQRPVEVPGRSTPKDVAATQGSEYIGYIDGTQVLSVPK